MKTEQNEMATTFKALAVLKDGQDTALLRSLLATELEDEFGITELVFEPADQGSVICRSLQPILPHVQHEAFMFTRGLIAGWYRAFLAMAAR